MRKTYAGKEALFITFKPYFLKHLLFRTCPHKNSCSECAVFSLKVTNAIFRAIIGAFVQKFKTPYFFFLEKTPEYNFGLVAAVRGAFLLPDDINPAIKVFC